MPHVEWLPKDGTLRHIFRRWPELAKPLSDFTEVLMRGDSPFTAAQRELIAAVTSATNECSFCYGSHKAAAEAFGIDAEAFEQIATDIESADIDEAMKPVIAYVKKLTISPARISQRDVDAIFDAGWNEKAFHHATSICGLFNYYNRILEGYGISRDQEYYDEAGGLLADLGYRYSTERYAVDEDSREK